MNIETQTLYIILSFRTLGRFVQKISNEVLHALTGIEAVETYRNNPDLDLIFMDIRMSEMNECEATRQISQSYKDVII